MSRLEELIQRYCPEGVEYRPLGEVCNIKGRIGFRGYTRDDQVKEGEGALSLSPSNIQEGQMDYSKGTYITWAKYDESPEIMIFNGDVIFCKTASVGKVALVKDLPYKATINPQLVVLKDIQCNAGFLTYVLGSDSIQKKVVSIAGVGSVPNVSQKALSEIEIPVPPLPVQEEIVRILDTFTELQAELQKRKQQYNYYCNKLLTESPEVEKVNEYSLGEIASFTYGYTTKAEEKGEIRYIRITDINDRGGLNIENAKFIPHISDVEPYLLHKGDLVMARTGATFGKTLFFNEDYPAAYASFLIKISLNNKVIPKYYWHFSKSVKYWEQANRLVGGGAQPQFNTGAISQVKITLPSLEMQQKIVDILDRFDTLTGDLAAGLPAEIEKRRQQYEYYRDKLLTFKRYGSGQN